MRRLLAGVAALAATLVLAGCGSGPDSSGDDADVMVSIAEKTAGTRALDGFVDIYWEEGSGKLYLKVEQFATPFLYVSWLARGIGSNDIGLDRGQMGANRVVEFYRSGPRVLLVQTNPAYRASAAAALEQLAVKESFAISVLGGFDIVAADAGAVLIDASEFFLRDAHNISGRLSEAEEGEYAASAELSAIYLPKTRSFPDNTEVEAIVTFTGKPTGTFLPEVVPEPTRVSVHMHHSLVRLPDDGYTPLAYEPRSGYIDPENFGYFKDYATPIHAPLQAAYTPRHRLHKQDPSAAISEAVEPIVYYVDPGVPEPIRSALVEGASWWDQAFAAAGYKNAFRVELLPADADPLDVRYNVIQWVHRATRGWSYGSSVVNPLTGEIIKGHVTLGSLRVRQDYLLAEGMLAPYGEGAVSSAMQEFALARLRQLSAHEVGHTLGLEHNFAASTNDRASVMDYPFPLVTLDAQNKPDLSQAYGVGIGAWDKRAITYGYQDVSAATDATAARRAILQDTLASGLRFIGDTDSRHIGTANPLASLWDNGSNAIDELARLMRVRRVILDNFSVNVIRPGRPLATIEEALVPMYLLHRFQAKAAGKFIGGQYFSYALRGDGQTATASIPGKEQWRAIETLLQTLSPTFLQLSPALVRLIPPRPPGIAPSRELFPRHSGGVFDPVAAAESAAALSLRILLEPHRATRMNGLHAQDATQPGFAELVARLIEFTWQRNAVPAPQAELQRGVNNQVVQALMELAGNAEAATQVRAVALDGLLTLQDWIERQATVPAEWRAHYRFASAQIARLRGDVGMLPVIVPAKPPPGSPIGSAL